MRREKYSNTAMEMALDFKALMRQCRRREGGISTCSSGNITCSSGFPLCARTFHAVCLLAALVSASALRCYKSEVKYDALKSEFTLLPTDIQNCPSKSTKCITRTFSKRDFVTHDCQKEENCTADVEVVIDTTSALAVQYGENKYSCCNYDFCNDNALRVPAAPPPNPNSLKRPQCSSANSWIYKPYEVNSNASMNVDPRLMELRLDLGAETSKWTLHTAPPQSKSWLFSQDTSTPDCFTIAGVIQKGFCGIRYKVDPENGALLDEKTFRGKYYNQYCGASKAEAVMISNAFALLNANMDRDRCLASLIESDLSKDCTTMGGQYNIVALVKKRRKLLPDCCMEYIEIEPEKRFKEGAECKCEENDNFQEFSPFCKSICCCERSLMKTPAEERCTLLEDYIKVVSKLEQFAYKQCCFTRQTSQCSSTSHCRDSNEQKGSVTNLSSFPMCCDYCENFYADICSFRKILPSGEEGDLQSMKDRNYIDRLKDVCKRKYCRNKYPCAFVPTTSSARTASTSSILTVLLGALVTYVSFMCHTCRLE